MSPKTPWWQRRWGVAAIGVVCLIVGIGIGGASSSSKNSKPAPTPAQLAAQAEATKARIHQEEVERAANQRAHVANEKKEAREKSAEARVAARKAGEEAAQKHHEEQKEKQEAAEKLANENKVLSGSASENVGTVNVETESTLTWTCEGCGESNFVINASSGPTGVLVNSLKETSGHTVIDEGTYKNFEVEGTGPWTVKISPNG
jgi:rubrerythrin